METTRLIISMLIFLAVLSALFTFQNSLLSSYGSQATINNKEIENLMNEIKEQEERNTKALAKINNPNPIDKLLGWFDLLFGNVYNIFASMILLIPNTISLIINYISNFLPVPSWLTTLVFGSLFAILGSSIIYIIMKVKI
ncbi:MAG: hypothetical protein QXJ14_02730 [Candidatus Aenigmatarchaeota archaeon]